MEISMKKMLSLFVALCIAMLALAACGGAPSSAPASGASPLAAASTPASQSTPAAASTPATVDLDAALASMVEAAELGNTIEVSDIDLMAAGVNTDNVLAFAGAQSQLVAQNGGQVIIIQAVPGMAEMVETELNTYREALIANDDYAEFEEARNNIENASMVVTYPETGIVVWAVAANGNATAITDAITELFGAQ